MQYLRAELFAILDAFQPCLHNHACDILPPATDLNSAVVYVSIKGNLLDELVFVCHNAAGGFDGIHSIADNLVGRAHVVCDDDAFLDVGSECARGGHEGHGDKT